MPYNLRLILFLSDIGFLNLAFYFSNQNQASEGDMVNLIYLVAYSNLAWLFLVLVANPYAVTKNWTLSRVARSQLMFIGIHLLVIASLIVFFQKSYTVAQIIMIYLIFIPLFFLFRIAVFYIRRIAAGEVTRNYIIVGNNDLAKEVRRHFLLNPEEGYRFAGIIEFEPGFMDKIQFLTTSREIHQIFYCVPGVQSDGMKQLVDYGLNSLISVKIVVDSRSGLSGQSLLNEFELNPGVEIPTLALDEAQNQFVKRIFDLGFALILFSIVLWWFIPLVAIIIKLDSRGPVFFRQMRNGRSNKPFPCLKFRTMGVEKSADFKQAVRDDPRITRIGKLLRKSSIDEIPQFINVLRGEMSVIGPRPHPIKLNEQFLPLISNLMSRHYVKPGVTGLAQCMGYRGETKDLADMENRVRLDRYYIENWSFWLDMKIIALTLVSLVRGSEKAY